MKSIKEHIEQIKHRKDNKKIYPANQLYVGQFTSYQVNPKGKDITNVRSSNSGEFAILEELKDKELNDYLQKAYPNSLPAFHTGDDNSVRYFKSLTRNNQVVPCPTVAQIACMEAGTLEAIAPSVLRFTQIVDRKIYQNELLSLNEIKDLELNLNSYIEENCSNTDEVDVKTDTPDNELC